MLILLLSTNLILLISCYSETERILRVSESVAPGTRVGFVTEILPTNVDQPNFDIIFPDPNSKGEQLFSVNIKTGEITTEGLLDYETESKFLLLIIPKNGSPTNRVVIELDDENDNTPQFNVEKINLEVSEYARIGLELPLPLAVDLDSPKNSIKKYHIVSGNVNNVFRLANRQRNDVLYADLIVNGQLDREYRDHYNLLVEAVDGGDPPKIGQLEVVVNILDANDNSPIFSQHRYTAKILNNATIEFEVVTVMAKDADMGENARISYRLVQQSDGTAPKFKIDETTGIVKIAENALPEETTYELTVVATDHGMPQPLETTAFLTIHVEHLENVDFSDISVVWLTNDGLPNLWENLTLGYVVARLSVNTTCVGSLSLIGTDTLCLKQTDKGNIYLMIVCRPLDRELHSEYRLQFVLKNNENETVIDHPLHVELLDVNDNAPVWNQSQFHILFNRTHSLRLQNVYRFIANDHDLGENARVHYSLRDTNFFEIDSTTGVLRATKELPCTNSSDIRFQVIATDYGLPPLSSAVDIVVDVVEAYRKPPIFNKALYEITVKEDTEIGTCLLQVSAFDNVCGQFISRVRYSLQESFTSKFFKIDETSGRICLTRPLDFERMPTHHLILFAHNSVGKSKTLANVIIEDVNDNAPIFNPQFYNLTLFDGVPNGSVVLTVHAKDIDSKDFGRIHYTLEDSQERLFWIDSMTGNLYTNRVIEEFSNNTYRLTVWAKDTGGLTSIKSAHIFVTVNPTNQDCPKFTKFLYEFNVSEDIMPNIAIGTVEATSSSDIRYFIQNKELGFKIDERLGRISVTKELDADEESFVLLNLEAKSYSGCFGFAQAKILIHDLNDNSPQFDFTNMETTLLENFPIHESFFAIQATDRDKNENGKITFELVSSEPLCPVIIRPLTGQLFLAASLDYEKVQKYRLRIRAIDQGLPPRTNETFLTLVVQDVNDNAPEFINGREFFNIEIPENAPLMSDVIRLKAIDKDSEENGIVQYRIVDDNIPEFDIEPITGQIFLKQTLDRETIPEYTLTVMAYDLGTPQLFSNATLRIRVLDINDNTPNCSTITPVVISDDDIDHSELLTVLNAYDPDNRENGTVTYRLQQPHEFFELKRSGELRLKKRIFHDNFRRLYHLSVIAEDQGKEPRSIVCQVVVRYEESRSLVKIIKPLQRILRIDSDIANGTEIIRIEATNAKHWSIDNKSELAKYFAIENGSLRTNSSIRPESFHKPQHLTVKISDSAGHSRHVTFTIRLNYKSSGEKFVKLSEDTAIGVPILNLNGPTANSDRYFTLNESSKFFEIDETSGTVFLAGRLNYKHLAEHTFKVASIDLNTKDKNITTVTVEIERTHEKLPAFSAASYQFSVSEDTPIGASIGRVDLEETFDDFNVHFKLNDKSSTFNIDRNSGEIYLQKSLNYNIASEYYLLIEAQENSLKDKLLRHCIVYVNIVDVNNNIPAFISLPNVTISSATQIGEPIHYFVALDQDSGKFGTVTFSILSGNNGDFFKLNETTGSLTLKKRLHEPKLLTVRASDGDAQPKFADQLFNVFVESESSKSWKYFEKDHYDFILNADVPIGFLVHNFKQLNEPMVTFVLLPETQGEFKMDTNDGILKTVTLLTQKTYRLVVLVHAPDRLSSDYTTIHVNIKNFPNKGPKIIASSCGNITVRENLAHEKLMRIFTVTDNSDAPITYHIEGSSDHELFSINASTGVISCKDLDRETRAEHFLIVSATDNSLPKKADVCTVRIKVQDENDNLPIIHASLETIEINDDTPGGMVLTKFTASDLDEGDNGKIKFMLVDDKSYLLDLNPNNGELIFARDLPFTESEWAIVISAMDSGKSRVLSSEKRVRILYKRRKTPANNGAPEFLRKKYVAYVQESLPKGQLVAQVQTTFGLTREAPLTYSIVGGNFDSAFEIDGSGRIRTSQELDAEIESEYKLRVIATGSPLKTPETMVEVRVLNINDNAPSFSHVRKRRISETLPTGSLITMLNANDVDDETQLEYSINPSSDFFEIDRHSGALHLTQPIDYEEIHQFILEIQAYDGIHFANTTLTIDVQDANDNAPFLDPIIEIGISPSAKTNSQIGKIVATDPDQGRGGEIYYELITGNNYIRVDRATGIVTLLEIPLKGITHFATLKASDSGTPSHSAMATILLRVVPKPYINAPLFEKTFYTFVVNENFALHQTLGIINVTTRSEDDLKYRYTIVDLNSNAQFYISSMGELSLKKSLDRETQREYRFQVNLTSPSDEFQPTFTTVLVQVSDINDNPPRIEPETTLKEIRIEERMKKDTILGRLSATDPDFGENSRLNYSIVSGNDLSLIKIDSNTGVVQFDHWDDLILFDFDVEESSMNMTFLIEDHGTPSKWIIYNVPLLLDIRTWSGSAPMFPIPSYHRYVLESTPQHTVILHTKATTRWGKQFPNWKYAINNHDEIFGINMTSGEIILMDEIDYERRKEYEFEVQATDMAQRSAIVSVHIHVIGVDEFSPVFTNDLFRFQIPMWAGIGQRIGTIIATDADAGVDGEIHYAIQELGVRFVGIDPHSGVLVVRQSLVDKNNTHESFTVIATSGKVRQSTAKVYIEITDQMEPFPSDTTIPQAFFQNSFLVTICIATLGLVALFLSILAVLTIRYRFFCCCFRKKKPIKQMYSVGRGNIAAMADINGISPKFPKIPPRKSSTNPQDNNAKPHSLISSSSSENTTIPLRSNLTDIYGNRSHPDSGIDPDLLSLSSSVTDYLMQIGVTPTDLPSMNMNQRQTEVVDKIDEELNELIYAKIEEILGSGPINYCTSPSPSTSLFPHLLTEPKPPQFQPLKEVFAQISRLKEEKMKRQNT